MAGIYFTMKILIYSGYCNGLGDLSFGKKVADLAQAKYPHAEIVLLTSSSEKFRSTVSGVSALDKYNASSDRKFIPYDQYVLREGNPEPDLFIAGPTLNFSPDIVPQLISNRDTPIVLMSEYNFATFHMEDLVENLGTKGYQSIAQMPTGLGSTNHGIFIDNNFLEFDRSDPAQLGSLFTKKLTHTGATILGDTSPSQYLDTTNVAVSYSHNNARRFLTVHGMLITPDRNTDVIIMGEEEGGQRKDRPVLQNIVPLLLEKGFGRIIYQEIGQEPQIIAESDKWGPTYRVIHTGRVGPEEAQSLRMIGGGFSGATGDQSYSEAIATSHMIVYECQSWKRDLVKEMCSIANQVDPLGNLARAVELLSSAETHTECAELADLLRQPAVQENFKVYRERIIQDSNLTKALQQQLEISASQVQSVQRPEQRQSIVARLYTAVVRSYAAVAGFFRPATQNIAPPEIEPPSRPPPAAPNSTSKMVGTLVPPSGAQSEDHVQKEDIAQTQPPKVVAVQAVEVKLESRKGDKDGEASSKFTM